ncbi:hypothetical protein [Streptomyces sp. NPDC003077]|uniref:hypothetical protein n=1 Tax=Streptomyces sp. NPDC003077 TaxID=3154443 RepID=UPI0033AB155D
MAEVSARIQPGLVSPTMSLHTTAQHLVSLAEAGKGGGGHESLSPYVTGGGALIALLLLLWITTRFNRDR